MGKKDDLRRLADAAERIANALEKLSGVPAVAPEPVKELLAAPMLDKGRADVFHALLIGTSTSPACGVHRRQGRPDQVVDMTRAVPQSCIPDGKMCGHGACSGAFAGAGNVWTEYRNGESRYVTTLDIEPARE